MYPFQKDRLPAFDRSGKANRGLHLETVVHSELRRRGAEVSYVRTANGFEVDFLARYPAGERFIIQVCGALEDDRVIQRELRALEDATRQWPNAVPLLLYLGSSSPKLPASSSMADLQVIPVLDWLLQDQA